LQFKACVATVPARFPAGAANGSGARFGGQNFLAEAGAAAIHFEGSVENQNLPAVFEANCGSDKS